MAKKAKKPEAVAPLWVLTYGDMMSLLLVFFIMIVSLSEIKKEDDWKAIVAEVQVAFGMKGGGGKMPTKDDPQLTLQQRIEQLMLQQQREENRSNTDDPGIDGKQPQVTQIREGIKYAIGGRITFEPGAADLSSQVKRRLRNVVETHKLKDTNWIIELRGHAASGELSGGDAAYPELWSLGFARARAVMEFLTSEQVGLRSERFRLTSNGDREPVAQRVYTEHRKEPNRRVEVIVSETLVRQLTEPEGGGGPRTML